MVPHSQAAAPVRAAAHAAHAATPLGAPAAEGGASAHLRAWRAYRRLMNVIEPLRIELWDQRGLTMTQIRLLYLLLEENERPVGALAQEMGVRPSAVTALTDRLVAAGLIERRRDREDRRVVRVALTDEGLAAVETIQQGTVNLMQAIFADLPTARLDQLADLFDELADAGEQFAPGG